MALHVYLQKHLMNSNISPNDKMLEMTTMAFDSVVRCE